LQPAISLHDQRGLETAFDRLVARPRWRPWLKAFDKGASSTLQISGVKIGPILSIFRDMTEGGRYRSAAWNWLRPNKPCPALCDLGMVQANAGLDHFPRQEFAKRLVDNCRAVARDQTQLARWVRCREAALEFAATPPGDLPAELADGQVFLRRELTRATLLSLSDPKAAAAVAHSIARNAMNGAARAVNHVLGSDGSSLSANLMIPVHRAVTVPIGLAPNAANALMAETLWSGVEADVRLVIVAETQGSNHAGFWVPVAKGQGGEVLPGATRAFLHREGDVVFKDDLPPLRGFSLDVERKWMGFMNQEFNHQLFVALPFRAPDGAGGHAVPAVLNVNVETSDVGRWGRAHHPEWLATARCRAQPFIEIALGALLVRLHVTRNPLALATGSEAWDTLIGVVPRASLGEGTS
jgi:hypothetical protein